MSLYLSDDPCGICGKALGDVPDELFSFADTASDDELVAQFADQVVHHRCLNTWHRRDAFVAAYNLAVDEYGDELVVTNGVVYHRSTLSFRFGSRDGYHWLWSMEGTISEVLDGAPELVLGQFIAITAYDSGAYRPSAKQSAAGWQVQGNVTFSPRVEQPEVLPLGGWDEWYVMSSAAIVLEPRRFVHDVRFKPMPDEGIDDLDKFREVSERTEAFWRQLLAIQPLAYLVQNDGGLSVVVRDEVIFSRLRRMVEVIP